MAEFIPISNLPHIEEFTPRDIINNNLPPVVWGVHVSPAVDIDRIQLNARAIHRYHAIGSIKTSVVLEYQGETTDFTPSVSGINADGSALATCTGVINKAHKSNPTVFDPMDIPSYTLSEYGKPTIAHRLNKTEMAQNISDDVSTHGLFREDAWAK